MCQYSAKDGFANDWHLVHLVSRAVGGAGIVFTEATAVSPEGRITYADLGLWKNEHIDFLKRITSLIHLQGSIAAIQLAHAGRKASHHEPWKGSAPLKTTEGRWQTFAPSAIPYKQEGLLPKEMTKDDIKKVITDFCDAAKRAIDAGFKIIEIHAAHGYLINEFLSPLSNIRTDEYGGSFDNRIRLLIEIVEETRKILSEEFPLFVRISATDWMEGGWTVDDSIKLSAILKDKGVDVIDCSSGGNISSQKIAVGPLYQVPFAEKIKTETKILTGAVGMITTAIQAEEILNNKQADLIFLARQFLRDPYFALHAAKELNVDIPWPDQYDRAKK